MNAPIGIFDSGIGGLTVAKAFQEAFPNESLLYFGDTAHLPYGEKSNEAIQEYALGIADFLLSRGCKLLVIACNSASAAAKDVLVQHFGHRCPIVDVITPLIEDIASRHFGKVGVIATKATVRSDIYARELHGLQPELEVVSLATALLAPIIEEGFFNNSISQSVIHKYLSYPDFEDIQALLLACTHYPLIREEIEAYFQGRVEVFDSIAPVIRRIGQLLDEHQLHSHGTENNSASFFVSDYTKSFEQTAQIFYQKSISLQIAKWDKNGRLEIV